MADSGRRGGGNDQRSGSKSFGTYAHSDRPAIRSCQIDATIGLVDEHAV